MFLQQKFLDSFREHTELFLLFKGPGSLKKKMRKCRVNKGLSINTTHTLPSFSFYCTIPLRSEVTEGQADSEEAVYKCKEKSMIQLVGRCKTGITFHHSVRISILREEETK